MLDSASKFESTRELQRRIVTAMQDGLPIVPHPYRDVAQRLGITEQELLDEMQSLLDRRAVRRIGVVPNHYVLGYSYNLMVVWDVEDSVVDAVGENIGTLDFVSHCYRRPRKPGWPYNLFVMVHGKTEREVEQKVDRLREQVGPAYRGHTALRSTKILKKTGLRLGPQEK